jgi:hypothetical protein
MYSQGKENETTLLDSSTVPTYEEFQYKTKLMRFNQPQLDQTPQFLNSTEYFERTNSKILITDDESDDDNQTVLENSLTENPKITDQLSFRLGNININSLTPKTRDVGGHRIQQRRANEPNEQCKPKSYGHRDAVKTQEFHNSPKPREYGVTESCKTKIPEQRPTPKAKEFERVTTTPKSKKHDSPAMPSRGNLNESVEYLEYCNKIVQTSPFLDQESSDNESNLRLYLSNSCNKTETNKSQALSTMAKSSHELNDSDDEPKTPTTRTVTAPMRFQQESSACPKTLIRVLNNFTVRLNVKQP